MGAVIAQVQPGRLYAWKGPSLLIGNGYGHCAGDEALSGYYFKEARFIRTLRLTIDGESPWLCEAASVRPDTLTFTYAYPEIADGRAMPQRALAIRLSRQHAATLECDRFLLLIHTILGLQPVAALGLLVAHPALPSGCRR